MTQPVHSPNLCELLDDVECLLLVVPLGVEGEVKILHCTLDHAHCVWRLCLGVDALVCDHKIQAFQSITIRIVTVR